jgi:hypothetical protein
VYPAINKDSIFGSIDIVVLTISDREAKVSDDIKVMRIVRVTEIQNGYLQSARISDAV